MKKKKKKKKREKIDDYGKEKSERCKCVKPFCLVIQIQKVFAQMSWPVNNGVSFARLES